MQKLPGYILQWYSIIVFITVVLTGCTGTPPTPTSIPITPCPPEAALDNTYALPPNPLTNPIFQYAAPTPDPFLAVEENQRRQDRAILEARYAALELLKYEAARWTKSITVPLDAANNVQILVTFLSRDLLMAVLQNNIFAHSPRNVDVYAVMNSNLSQITNRKELIFLVTVIVANPNGGAHIIDMDIHQLSLKNSDNHTIPPQHDDHNLDQPINLSQGPAFGFLYYPLAIQMEGVCKQVLDRDNNTKINIETSSVLVDSVPQGPFIWTIPYAPLVDTGSSFYTPAYPVTPTLFPQSPITQVELDASLFSPLNLPPVDMTNEFFWRDFGRFIWGQVTLENY
jgi:hypothetical protein